MVNVNENIHHDLLEHFLVKEFKKHNLEVDFEYAIYDCDSEKMVYGKYLSEVNDSLAGISLLDNQGDCNSEDALFEQHYKPVSKKKECGLPTCEKYTYYFGVFFPNRSKYYSSQVHAWYVVNGFLIIVILFFNIYIKIII